MRTRNQRRSPAERKRLTVPKPAKAPEPLAYICPFDNEETIAIVSKVFAYSQTQPEYHYNLLLKGELLKHEVLYRCNFDKIIWPDAPLEYVKLVVQLTKSLKVCNTKVRDKLFEFAEEHNRADIARHFGLARWSLHCARSGSFKSPRHTMEFIKWSHEEGANPLDFTLELKALQNETRRHPEDEVLLYMMERYKKHCFVRPVRLFNRTTHWDGIRLSKNIVEWIEAYDIPICKVDRNKYESWSREVMGGDWGARRNLILFRRTMWK